MEGCGEKKTFKCEKCGISNSVLARINWLAGIHYRGDLWVCDLCYHGSAFPCASERKPIIMKRVDTL